MLLFIPFLSLSICLFVCMLYTAYYILHGNMTCKHTDCDSFIQACIISCIVAYKFVSWAVLSKKSSYVCKYFLSHCIKGFIQNHTHTQTQAMTNCAQSNKYMAFFMWITYSLYLFSLFPLPCKQIIVTHSHHCANLLQQRVNDWIKQPFKKEILAPRKKWVSYILFDACNYSMCTQEKL